MSNVIIYTTDDGVTKIDLRLESGTIWLSQLQIAELFQTSKQNISKHIQAIYDDHELEEQTTVNHELTVQKEYLEKGFALNDERLKNLIAAITGKNCSTAFAIFVPAKKSCTAKRWTYTPLQATTTPKAKTA